MLIAEALIGAPVHALGLAPACPFQDAPRPVQTVAEAIRPPHRPVRMVFTGSDTGECRIIRYTLSPAEAEFDGLTARSETIQLCL
jgi:hypothetical protein